MIRLAEIRGETHRRLPWNGTQCERAGQSDMRAAMVLYRCENVPRPASFVTQVGREFGVRNLSCPAKVMTAFELPDMGSYHCVYTYGANDANLRKATLVVADGNKVGLYDADGKALK